MKGLFMDELSNLRWSVVAMTQDPDTQKKITGSRHTAGEEIVLEFTDAFEECLDKGSILTTRQKEMLLNLNAYISSISGDGFDFIWLDESGLYSQEWGNIRTLAKQVLKEFRWENICASPLYEKIYIK